MVIQTGRLHRYQARIPQEFHVQLALTLFKHNQQGINFFALKLEWANMLNEYNGIERKINLSMTYSYRPVLRYASNPPVIFGI